MSNIKRNERRRKHYRFLREAGYSGEVATKLKDFDLFTVLEICKIKKEAMQNVDQIDDDLKKQVDLILKEKRK